MLSREVAKELNDFPPTQFFSFCPTGLPDERLPQDDSPTNDQPLAYAHAPGNSPGIMFLPGFMSSMKNTKSKSIYRYCRQHGLEFTSLDYSGHSETRSKQDYNDDSSHTISQWMEEALCILQHVTVNNQQIVVGSSMGAWIALLLAQYEKQRVQEDCNKPLPPGKISGILGIASGPDFTSIWSEQIEGDNSLRTQMSELGYCDIPTAYDETGFYRIYHNFLQDAKEQYILDRTCIDLGIPVTLIHGTKDTDVPYTYSEQLLSKLKRNQTNALILVEDGDHRLSKPHELEQILQSLDELRWGLSEVK